MTDIRNFDFSPSLPNWRRSFWAVYILLTFGVAAAPNSLLGTLSVLLLAAPVYAVSLVTVFFVWRPSLPDARLQNALAAGVRGGMAVLWRSVVLFVPVMIVVYLQLHLLKVLESPGTAVFAWPKSAPSVVVVTALLGYLPLANYLAVRSSVTDGWQRLTGAAPDLVRPGVAFGRLSIALLAVFVLFAGANIPAQGRGWQALAWPVSGIRNVAEESARLWTHYDTSRPWRVGATYVFGEGWKPRIIKSGMELNHYNIVELTPKVRKHPQGPPNDSGEEDAAVASKIDSILIYSGGKFSSVHLEPRSETGEFSCTRSSYDLIQCQLASAYSQATPGSSRAYLADLISERRFDRDTERAMDPKKQHEVERKGVYVMSERTKPRFFAHCDSGVCTTFSVYQTDDGESGIQVVFSERDLPRWRAITAERDALLSRFHDRAEAILNRETGDGTNE